LGLGSLPMYASAFMAFLHHIAAFSVVGALAAEVVLLKPPLTLVLARRIQRTDQIFGAAAGVVLVVGLLRVFYFEKGADYYFHNAFFLTKLTLFIVAALISIYPTVLFISWNTALRQGEIPALAPEALVRTRMCLMLEMTAILGILFCAPFMARGFG
jgi:putative membrane protein